MTQQRKAISDLIRRECRHLTAEEIYAELHESMPKLALGTVYRNLRLMEQAGEIRRIVVAEGSDRYDKNLTPHEHATCLDCGSFFDLDAPQIREAIERSTGISVIAYRLEVDCLCPSCQKRRKAQSV